jgi:Tfp pilus assembly protein PilX
MKALRRTRQGWRRQRGVSLVVVLLLLAVIMLLASTAIRMSVGEIRMAGNEQFHREAVDAASTGLEVLIARLGNAGGAPAVRTSTESQAIGTASGFTASVRAAGVESVLVGSSAGRLSGEHFEIESTGNSSREARDVQVQGVMVVTASNGVARFSRIGTGLSEGAEP